jgi:hypothetical protein
MVHLKAKYAFVRGWHPTSDDALIGDPVPVYRCESLDSAQSLWRLETSDQYPIGGSEVLDSCSFRQELGV